MSLFNFMMPAPMKSGLEDLSKRTGLSLSEHARRAMDEYLERQASAPKQRPYGLAITSVSELDTKGT